MRIDGFTSTADLIGRRVRLRWVFLPEPGETVPSAPAVRLRRKQRDFEFPEPGPAGPAGDPYLVHDSVAFPPAPVPDVRWVQDLPDIDRADRGQRIRERTVSVSELAHGQRCEVLRHTVRSVFSADRTLLRREVELLDVGGHGAELTAGVTYYYQLDSATPDGGTAEFRTTATPGQAHGHHRQLYQLLPEIIRRHDTVARPPDVAAGLIPEAAPAGGQLRRFLDVFGATLDSLRSSAEGLRVLRDVARVDARFLPLLAQWIGWDLTADADIARQRTEIATAPRMYGAVGTVPGLRSVVDHYTGWSTRVAEFAQQIVRTNQAPQGNLFAARLRDGAWWGGDDAAPVLGLTSAAAAELVGTVRGPFALAPGMTLTVAVDGALPVTVTFGAADFAAPHAATAAEVAAVLARELPDLLADQLADQDGGRVRLRSRLTGERARVEVLGSGADLLSLDGAPRGRLATATDPDSGVLWLAHASGVGAGGPLPRLMVKPHLRGTWYDNRQVEPAPVHAATDPALVTLPDGRLWLAWVAEPGTGRDRLCWRRGRPEPFTPALLRGEATEPFALTADTRLTIVGEVGTETFRVRAQDFPRLAAVTAEQLARAVKKQLTDTVAVAAADGSLVLQSAGSGPGVARRIDLAASTAARALGFADPGLAGHGGWLPEVAWDPPLDGPVPPGWYADCTAAGDRDGSVRLFWSTHRGGAWRIERARWVDRHLVATPAGLAALAGDGGWSTVATAPALPSADVRAVAADADGSIWVGTAAGAAVLRPDAAPVALTAASTGGGLADDDIRSVAVAPDGTVWFAHGGGASARGPAGDWRTLRTPDGDSGLPGTGVRQVVADRDGTIWFGTDAGVAALPDGGRIRRYGTRDGLPSTDVRGLAVAPDGAVWVLTGGGPARIEGTAVRPVAGPRGEPRAVAAGPGSVWVATAAGLAELAAGRVRMHGASDGLPSLDCRSVLVDPDGTVWAGTAAGLARRSPGGSWRVVPAGDGPAGAPAQGLHGPWSAPMSLRPDGASAGEREPHVCRDGTQLWLTWARRQPATDRWLIRGRRFDPARGWSAEIEVTAGSAGDREPSIELLPAGGIRVDFRSDRGGGRSLWSVEVATDGAGIAPPGAPVPITSGATADTNPAPVTLPDGTSLLLFRSDRNVPLGRLGGGVPDAATAATPAISRAAPDEAAVRRFAGSVTVDLADLDRNRARRRFDDLQCYTPHQPGGGPLAPDDLYTPSTIGLYVERGPAGRPLVRRDADRLRQLLGRFLPVNLRAVVVLRSDEQEELVFRDSPLTDRYRDDYPQVETVLAASDGTAVRPPGWLLFLSTDSSSLTADPTRTTTLGRRTWSPPFQ